MDRGFAPETPVKGGITLDEPVFAIRPDCDRLNRPHLISGSLKIRNREFPFYPGRGAIK